MEKIRQGGDI